MIVTITTRVSTKNNNTLKKDLLGQHKKLHCVKGPNMWNILNIGVKLCKATVQFKKKYKAVLLEAYKT